MLWFDGLAILSCAALAFGTVAVDTAPTGATPALSSVSVKFVTVMCAGVHASSCDVAAPPPDGDEVEEPICNPIHCTYATGVLNENFEQIPTPVPCNDDEGNVCFVCSESQECSGSGGR